MSRIRSQMVAWQALASAALERGTQKLGQGTSRTLARMQPALSPLIEKAALQFRRRPSPTSPAAVRVALIEYFRAVVQTPGVVAPGAAPLRQPSTGVPEGMLHLAQQVERRRMQMQRLKRFDDQDDPIEAVHQLRVASRRLRAFVDMFGPLSPPELVKAARRPLRQLTRSVRDLRDADVQSESLQKRVRRAGTETERIALNHLLQRTRSLRQKQVVLARKRLGSIDFYAMAEALRKMLDHLALRAQSPSANYEVLAKVAFEPVLSEARRHGPRNSEALTSEQLHQFRLSLKKVRYAAELLEPVLGERFEGMHRHAKQLQSLLGEHQDSVEFEKLVKRRYEKAVQRRRSVLSTGLQQVLGQAVRERKARYERCTEACHEGAAPKLFELVAGTRPASASVDGSPNAT